MADDVSRRARWTAIFSRRGGGAGSVRAWSAWEPDDRESMLARVSIEEGELPVLGARPHEARAAMVLTTRRLHRGDASARVDDIVGVTPPRMTERMKTEWDVLDVHLLSGDVVRVETGPGSDLLALWAVLLHVARRNAAQRNEV